MDFFEAARRVHLNRSVAFFGAGFSLGAKSVEGTPLSGVGTLAKNLSVKSGETETLPLSVAAQVYQEKNVLPEIRDVIRQEFTVGECQAFHTKLASLPWLAAYTTNYDNLLEFGRRSRSVGTNSVTANDRPADHAGYFSFVHLHGFVERISPSDWDETYVLTETQYASDILNNSGWLERFRNDSTYADAIFFFGYSLADLDIARLLYQNPDLVSKTFFVIGEKATRATEITVASYGTAIRMNCDKAADAFPEKSDPQAAKSSPFLSSMVEESLSAASAPPTRGDVEAFLVKGDYQYSHIARDIINGTSLYYVGRDAVAKAATALDRSEPFRLFFHSGLGNGKSCGLMELATYCAAQGRRALWFNGDTSGLALDVDYLGSLGTADQSKIVIFVENAFVFQREIKDLIHRFPLISFAVTARSAALQTRSGSIEDALGDDFELVDLTKLSTDEIPELDEILFANGLWGERQGQSFRERVDYISRKCRSDLATILIDVCKSSDIFARIRAELKSVEAGSSELKRSLVTVLCAAYAGVRLNVGQLCEIVQTDLFKYGKVQHNPILKEFVDFSDNRITARSPSFAEVVLRDLISDHDLLGMLPGILVRLDRLGRGAPIYSDLFKGMMRFGFIERVLQSKDKEKKLVSYYESVRASGVGLENPQFWLQYAIACMSFEDFKSAEAHFEAAFGLARARGGYNPYQIENHFARFLLESRTKSNLWDDYFSAIREANDILTRQMQNFEEGFYPYRVAAKYLDFVEANHSKLSKDQKVKVIEWCANLLRISDNVKEGAARSIYWKDARRNLIATKDYLQELL